MTPLSKLGPLMTKHRFFLLFVFYTVLSLIEAYAEPALIQQRVPVLRIQAQALSPLERGLDIGRQSKEISPDIETHYDTYLSTIYSQVQFNHLLKNKLPSLLTHLDKDYQDEMQGVMGSWYITEVNRLGDGFLSKDEYLVLNLLADISKMPNGTGFGVFGRSAQAKQTIIGRNLDWDASLEISGLQAITVYQYTDTAVVNIGFLGLISIITGFNHQGLFLSYSNATPYSPYTQYHQPTLSKRNEKIANIFALRKALETNISISQALNYFSKVRFESDRNILMADRKQIQVLEIPAKKRAKSRKWNSRTHPNKPWGKQQQIAIIDCHVLANLPDNCKDSKDSLHWFRLRTLATFDAQHPAKKKDVSQILFDTNNKGREIFNKKTLNSIIFIPANNHLYLYTAKSEATLALPLLHLPYLDVLPSLSSAEDKRHGITPLELLWGLLLILFFIIAWLQKLPSKVINKCKEMLGSLSV
jgi:hypothetical protein